MTSKSNMYRIVQNNHYQVDNQTTGLTERYLDLSIHADCNETTLHAVNKAIVECTKIIQEELDNIYFD